MNEQLSPAPQDILAIIEKAYGENGTSNYGCFHEVYRYAEVRTRLLARMGSKDLIQGRNRDEILSEIHGIVSSLPDLHNEELSQASLKRLEEIMHV